LFTLNGYSELDFSLRGEKACRAMLLGIVRYL
jgi:hypothetical protein